MIETTSLCPECYKEIKAVVYLEDGKAMMSKVCEEHGMFKAVVEESFSWWSFCQEQESPGIYGGYFVDVTTKCNIKCKYCFHDRNGFDRSFENIAKELRARTVKDADPVILFGGEPTIHGDFLNLCESLTKEFGRLSMVTNGTMTADKKFFDRILPMMMVDECNSSINLSIHKESNGADIQTLENAREKGVKINSILYVIDSMEDIGRAIELFADYSDVVSSLRLKNASKVWVEDKPKKKIFVSDMVKEISNYGSVEMAHGYSHKTGYANVILDNKLHIIPVCWYETDNIDLKDKDCAPWYRAHDGLTYNLLTAFLINEGIEKGFYRGKRLENIASAA